ncbi:MAG: 23S rRNA (adenine(1618)-N(6))-methyltransferase RlmF [Opitutus sp.]
MKKPRPSIVPVVPAGRPHPRNRHINGYDFDVLIRHSPELRAFTEPHPCGGTTVNFSNPAAVKALNRALLIAYYGIIDWDIPHGFLCPPIPSRADYIHHLADLLGVAAPVINRTASIRILDIGVGANCVYPIIGVAEYGWNFVGSEIDPSALAWAQKLVRSNPVLTSKVELRLQRSAHHIFQGVVEDSERFDACMCNPPFHDSPAEAAAGTLRKLKNLGIRSDNPALNFGGKSTELWCDGGETGFVRRMIAQSADQPKRCGWFTTLVSKRSSLPEIQRALNAARPVDVRILPMAQGQKQSRVVAWSFLSASERTERKNAAGTVQRL